MNPRSTDYNVDALTTISSRRFAMVVAGISALRVAGLVTEVAAFLLEHGSVELATLFDDDRFQLKIFYLADIVSLLNELSYSLQGKKSAEKISAFKK